MAPGPLGIVFDRSPLAETALLRRYLVPLPAFPPVVVREDVRAVARRGWEDRTRAEYVGVMVVRRLHGLLVDLGAPMDLQEVALVMLVHEQRHAALCAACAAALGSDGEVAFELPELQQARGPDPERDLVGMAVGTYTIGEGVAFALLRHAIRALPPSPYRDALRRIAADEGLHARIGGLLTAELRRASWMRWPGDDFAREIAASTLAAMRQREVVEPDEAALYADAEAAGQLAGLGIPEPGAFKRAYLRAVDAVGRGGFQGVR